MNSEFAYIRWLRQRTRASPGVLLGPGDDCAVIQPHSPRSLLVTTDMLMEGSCFRLAEAGAYRVGRKAMNVNLSDIAAMAGVPRFAVVSVGLPRAGGDELPKELFRGFQEAADSFDVAIVGGDTNSWDGALTISVTLIGEATERGAVRRGTARPGDAILVTGPLGGSILGKHLDFTPRVREALRLHEVISIRSMIDISDGLAKDLHHLCEESGCGAVLDAERIPVSEAAHRLSQIDGRSPLEHALHDGEDFELVFTAAEDQASAILDQRLEGIEVYRIGAMVETGYELIREGKREKLEPRGYEHQW